ncbi:MAG: hypothetical protein ACNI27_06850 [Desulfovibrio sp.]
MLTAKDREYKLETSSKSGAFSWSSKEEGSIDETVLHTEIVTGKGLKFKKNHRTTRAGSRP